MDMKRNLLAFVALTILSLSSCITRDGGSTTIKADSISKIATKEVKSFTYKGYKFNYYNVYNDGSGNFVMADNTSYITNFKIQFGLRVKTPYVYTYKEDDESSKMESLQSNSSSDYVGYYNFSIIEPGIMIRGSNIDDSSEIKDINIGQITTWC